MINIANNELEQAYIGSTPVDSIYLGEEKVWPEEENEEPLYEPGVYLVIPGGYAYSPDTYESLYGTDYSSVWGLMVTEGYHQVIIKTSGESLLQVGIKFCSTNGDQSEYFSGVTVNVFGTSYTDYDGQSNTTIIKTNSEAAGGNCTTSYLSSLNDGVYRPYVPAIAELLILHQYIDDIDSWCLTLTGQTMSEAFLFVKDYCDLSETFPSAISSTFGSENYSTILVWNKLDASENILNYTSLTPCILIPTYYVSSDTGSMSFDAETTNYKQVLKINNNGN